MVQRLLDGYSTFGPESSRQELPLGTSAQSQALTKSGLGAGVAMVVRLFGARSALPRRPVSFSPCSRARRRQALVRWSPPRRFEARRFWGLGSLPLPRAGRGHISSSNANLSRRSRPRRAVVTATACAGFRGHRGVHTKVGITLLLSLALGPARAQRSTTATNPTISDESESVGGSFAARWARMVLKRCSSERGEREKRFYGDGKGERRRTAF